MNELDIATARELLSSPKKIAIIPHRSPDGDAMGSSLAMQRFLEQQGHDPFVAAPNQFPDFLAWMPGAEKVLIYETDKEAVALELARAELVFILDFNALHRTGEMENVLSGLSVPFIMIDHHQEPDTFATVTYSDTSIGSTCELVYNFIALLGKAQEIDQQMATCLYTGIVTDSGSFRYSSTSPTTHRIVAELVEIGVNHTQVHDDLFDNSSFYRLQLLGQALRNLKVLPEHRASYITLSQKELDCYNYVKGDTEGIVNYGLRVKGVIFTAIFIEHTDEKIIKISFRSKGDFDVNKFARTHFQGGGHINAAGGKSHTSLEETVKKFCKILDNEKL
jgi:bifunctional oligoribonuclease and PAP phosphatase NrnA